MFESWRWEPCNDLVPRRWPVREGAALFPTTREVDGCWGGMGGSLCCSLRCLSLCADLSPVSPPSEEEIGGRRGDVSHLGFASRPFTASGAIVGALVGLFPLTMTYSRRVGDA